MYAVLHVPDFPLQSCLRAEPALQGKPVVLRQAAAPLVGLVTRDALDRGVCPGQALAQAAGRCPDLIVRSPHAGLEREATAVLVAAAFGVSPQIELSAPGTVTLELTALPVPRREPALLAALAVLGGGGLPASAGLGETPLLALYAAGQATPGQLLKGDTVLLAPLPLEIAHPTPGQSAILHDWGIRTLGQLTALSKADITHRLGRAGLDLWERARGGAPRPLVTQSPPRTFTASLDCEHELETLEPLLFIFRRFVDRLACELGNASLAAQALDLTLLLADDSQHGHFIRLPEAVTDANLLFRALQTYLETVRTPAAIRGVRLRIVPDRCTVRQRDLFDGGLRDPHGFADTLARVMALVGSDRVGRPVSRDTHRPDTFALEPIPPVLPPLPAGFVHPMRGMALRRHRPPTPARIELAGRQPAYVWTDKIRGEVRAAAGPWHASGDWWEQARCWQHEEWDVQLLTGGLYRLLRVPEDGWFIAGEYD